MFGMLAVDVLFAGLLLKGIREESRTGFNVIVIVFGILGVVTGVLTWRRAGRIDKPNRVSASQARWAGRSGAVLGTMARAGSTLAAAVLFIGSLVMVGPFVALFLRSFDREPYAERRARARLGLHANDDRTSGKTGRPAPT
ncbi:hypothetical protein [Planosporangium thailandense]|nr:hypothetical protein [Planosporangium thailandense]